MPSNPFQHDSKAVIGFFGSARPLSNFYPAKIQLWGLTFLDAEAAYQSGKIKDPAKRKDFTGLRQASAKAKGRTIPIRDDWEAVKNKVMEEVVYTKFSQNPDLQAFLLGTGKAYLEERNYWKDRYWGCDLNGHGENHLGKILMRVRERLKNP